jgi:elongation of very long chain fatty acids protein 4
MTVLSSYNEYIVTVNDLGDSILNWADPDHYRGHIEGWEFTDFATAFTIAIAYVFFVFVGSLIMSMGIPAIDPYPLMFVYNLSQIMLCAYMTIEAGLLAYRNDYTFWPCNDWDFENPPLANLQWLFYVSKIWDFWDTIFIVLGKKWRQLSFLHVYHHTTVFLFCWLNTHLNFDGDIFLTIFLNTFVHTVMYTYYFICMHTKIPETGKSLPIWWKSSLTSMQLVQFITMMTHAIMVLHKGCAAPHSRVGISYLVYIFSLFVLFAQFFVSSYLKPKKKKTA